MKLRLVIFDYDGLLVDSEKLAFIAEEKVLAKYGKPLTKELFEKYAGYSVADTIAEYIRHYDLPITAEEFSSARDKILSDLIEKRLRLMPGARELIEFLKSSHIPIAVASSGNFDYVKRGLSKFGLLESFENITSVDEVKKGKPNPDLFLLSLKKNNARHDQSVVIEDSVSGITAAKNAYIFSIAVPQNGADLKKYSQADAIAHSLKEAISIIEKLTR